jgi:beta-lactamase regulating signal transducer with metallopeptidase domain
MDSIIDIMADLDIIDIVRMSLSSSVLIAAVVIIRMFTLHKLPKKTFLVLWGIVVCRLLIPFSIPSHFSLYTGINTAQRFFDERSMLSSPAGMPIDVSMRHVLDTGGTYLEVGRMNVAFISPAEFLWLAGMFAFALFFIVVYIKYRREFRMSLPVENDLTTRWMQEHPLRRRVRIRKSDLIHAPLTYGIFRPVILLPKKTDWTDEMKLAYTLTHELVHIRRFDTLTKLMLTAAVCVHWFNPFVWAMYLLANCDIELSCDETVVQTFGYSMKSGYAMMLISMAEKQNKSTPLFNHFNKNSIRERILSIMKTKKISILGKALAAILVVSTAIVFATSAMALSGEAISNPDEKTIHEYLNTKTDNLSGKAREGKFYSAFTLLSTDRDKIYVLCNESGVR